MNPVPLTKNDRAFIQQILTEPNDDTARLVYADYLDEQHDIRGKYLRLEIELNQLPKNSRERQRQLANLIKMRETINTDWLVLIDRPLIENCREKIKSLCPQKWDGLVETKVPTIRLCSSCDKKVYYCGSIEYAQHHVRAGNCVAIPIQVPRKAGDLSLALDDTEVEEVMGRLHIKDEIPDDSKVVLYESDFEPDPVSEREPPKPRPWWKFW